MGTGDHVLEQRHAFLFRVVEILEVRERLGQAPLLSGWQAF